jgi:DNA-binding transcriptional MerR regulator
MLRHYDELGLLRPARVDPESGYRGYEARQLQRLNRLVALKELGFALSEAERLLDDVDVDELRGMLRVRRAELEAQIDEDHARLDRVEVRLRAIEREDDMPDDVSIKSLRAQRVAAVARPAPGLGLENVGAVNVAAFRDLNQALERSGVQGHCPYFTCYTGDEEAGTLIAYACAPVADDVQRVDEPAQILIVPGVPEAAVVVREGTVREIYSKSRIYTELATWLEAHGYVPAGAGRDVFHGEAGVFEVRWPVRRPGEPAPDLQPYAPEGTPASFTA